MTFSDFVESVLEIPISRELKPYLDKIYNSYSKNPEKCILYLESLRALSKSDFLVLLPLFLEIYDGLCFNTLPLEEVQRVLDKYKENENE